MKVKQKRRGDEVEDGVEQEGGRKLGRGDTMFRAIRDRPSETNERTTLNGQQQGLGIGFRKAAWGFYSFFDIIPPSASTFRVAVSLSNLLMWRATPFRNLLLSLAREKLPRQKLIGVS
jgi:hypothetical protein